MSRIKKATVEDKFYEIFEGMSASDQDGVFKILHVIQSLTANRVERNRKVPPIIATDETGSVVYDTFNFSQDVNNENE